MQIILYQFPAACSRVTMAALEEIGLDYEERCVNFRKEAQKSGDYLRVNPKAKVPALVVDGRVMTENPAIIAFLDRLHPEAALLPRSEDPVAANEGLSDLVWCGATLHPMVRQVRAPSKVTVGDPAGVHADGLAKFAVEASKMADRIGRSWWYGDAWSIVDTYLYWAYSTAEKGGFPLTDYPGLLDHASRVRARPALQRVLARERASLEREGITDVEL